MSRKLYDNSIKTSTKMGKRDLIIKASADYDLMAFEVSFANDAPFMFLIGEHFFIAKGCEDMAVGIMDSESVRWGEVGCQMFDSNIGHKPYKPGSILMLDPYVAKGGFVKNEVVFSDDFNMEIFISALMGTLSMFRSSKAQPEYFVFLGNAGLCPDDALWRKKFDQYSIQSFDLIRSFVGGLIPGCFLSVWENTPRKQSKVKCIKQGALPWADYAKSYEDEATRR